MFQMRVAQREGVDRHLTIRKEKPKLTKYKKRDADVVYKQLCPFEACRNSRYAYPPL